MTGGDDVELEAFQRLDRLRDDASWSPRDAGRPARGAATPGKHSRAWASTLITPAWLQAVSTTRPLPFHIHRDEAFVDQKFVRLPASAVLGAAVLAGQAGLERRAARDLAT